MQHLLDALAATAKSAAHVPNIAKDLRLIEQYLRTGDDNLTPSLRAIPSQRLWALRKLADALPKTEAWSIEDRRVVRFFAMLSPTLFAHPGQKPGDYDAADGLLREAVEKALTQEGSEEDCFAAFRGEFSDMGIEEHTVLAFAARLARPLALHGKLTSAGRFLASQSPEALAGGMKGLRRNFSNKEFLTVWIAENPDHATATADALMKRGDPDIMPYHGWLLLLEDNPGNREQLCASAFHALKNVVIRFELGRRLVRLFPEKYDEAVWEAAPAALHSSSNAAGQSDVARWMVEQRGVAAVEPLREYVANANRGNRHFESWKAAVIEETAKTLGGQARPMILAGIRADMPELRRTSLSALIGIGDPADEEKIFSLLEAELTAADSADVTAAIPIAASWNCERVAPRLWELVAHKSKPVREAAVAGLAKIGEPAVEKAAALFRAKKSETRAGAATLLGMIGSPAAVEALRRAFEAEKSEAVSDAIRSALAAAGGAGPEPEQTKASFEAAVRKAAGKIKAPASWMSLESLPPLYFKDGSPLSREAAGYVLFRQSRCKTIEPDSEIRPLLGIIDRARSGDFALAALNGFAASGADAADRWALAITGLFGDERIVPPISKLIQEWADSARGKLAEYAVQALALQASDPALLAVDALAIRFRTKYKNIGKAATEAFNRAAEARGLSPADLGDRVVPWLGFTPGEARVLSWGESRIEISIGLDFKPAYRDLVKDKRITSLPGGAPAELKTEMKDLSASLKEVVKAQHLRLENLMVQQHRWPAARWAELFLHHPLLKPFAVRLVWGAYDAAGRLAQTFRALEDCTLTTASDDPASAPASGSVGIVHPLELEAEIRQAWIGHLADYDIVSPFPQLERPVITPPPDQPGRKFFSELESIELNAMTFRGRAEKRGWVRGSVVDAGSIPYYYKPFPAGGVDVFLGLDGMGIGVDMYSNVTLGRFFFARHGSVKIGSYTYDKPSKEDDPRLMPAGEVSPIAYSEALGDLRQIAGRTAEAGV